MSETLLLEVKGLSRRFGGLKALDNVNVTQKAGELLGMIGPNGSGKSTFVNVISGALKANKGDIRLNGTQISGLGQVRTSRAGVARTFQAVKVFRALSVSDNLRAGALGHAMTPQEVDAKIDEVVTRVQLSCDLNAAASELGLFEQRKLEFAMRLMASPKLLLLDEPVGGLSPQEIRSMMDIIQSLRSQCGVFVIEHTMKVITTLADRVVVLVNGKTLIEDKPSVVLRDRAVIETYLG